MLFFVICPRVFFPTSFACGFSVSSFSSSTCCSCLHFFLLSLVSVCNFLYQTTTATTFIFDRLTIIISMIVRQFFSFFSTLLFLSFFLSLTRTSFNFLVAVTCFSFHPFRWLSFRAPPPGWFYSWVYFWTILKPLSFIFFVIILSEMSSYTLDNIFNFFQVAIYSTFIIVFSFNNWSCRIKVYSAYFLRFEWLNLIFISIRHSLLWAHFF